MKTLGAINGFPHLCNITKENVLQVYSTAVADQSKEFIPFYGIFLHEDKISCIKQFSIENEVGKPGQILSLDAFIDSFVDLSANLYS
jgi:hypothetical protein